MLSAKTILGFEVPASIFTSHNYKRTCNCSSHQQLLTAKGASTCSYHKQPWMALVRTDRKGYKHKDGTYRTIYSVVYPYTGDDQSLDTTAIVGIDLGYTFLSPETKTGRFKTVFDCVTRSLDMIAADFNLESLSEDLNLEYDSLRLFTVMYYEKL